MILAKQREALGCATHRLHMLDYTTSWDSFSEHKWEN